jgi:glucose/arabinose dehydrogenase
MTRTYPSAAALLLLFCAAAPPSPSPGTPGEGRGEGSPRTAPTTGPADYECRWTDDEIRIDGRADEPAWKSAQLLDRFIVGWEKARAPKTATRARLLWDREHLYFFAEMDDADLFADVKEHDGQIWTNDVFELFFKPAADKPGYYEFEVNAANAVLDMFIPRRGGPMWPDLKDTHPFEVKTAVQLRGTLNQRTDTDQGWSVEGCIRWRDMLPTGGRPAPGEHWTFALCRYDYSKQWDKPELSSTAPLSKGSFHQHENYTPIHFVGPQRIAGPATRAAWNDSKVIGTPEPPLPYRTEPAFPKLKTKFPVYVAPQPGTDLLVLAETITSWNAPSRIRRFRNAPDVTDTETLWEADRIIYGLTFHPRFADNGFVYVISNGPASADNKLNRVSRFTMDRQPPYRFDPKSEVAIIEWETNGHNGGDLAFGPDGCLYIPAGDGTSDSDPNLRGQDLRHLTSAMIRIDVDHPDPGRNYSVPKDNPFVGREKEGIRPEIYAYGFRNPWRMGFNHENGQLWVGNNGQDLWEQVYLVRKGDNFGWSVYEGSHPFQLSRKLGPTPHVKPVVEHHHSEFRSLTGGVVYTGTRYPELRGAYIYGDFSTGRIWAVKHDGQKVTFHKELADTPFQITAFRIDQNGELLVVDYQSGIHRIEPTPAQTQRREFPRKLSETGLFNSVKGHRVHPALLPYSVNAELWSDGAHKERFIALPGDSRIDHTPTRGWNFPEGAVLVKSFALEMEHGNPASRQWLETRLITRQQGEWAGYTYLWNDQQDEATLLGPASLDREYSIKQPNGQMRKQTWHFPSRAECMVCHSRAANFVLGPTDLQINKPHDEKRDGSYFSSERKRVGSLLPPPENQIRLLERLGMLSVDWQSHAVEAARRDARRAGMTGAALDQAISRMMPAADQRQPVAASLLTESPDRRPRLVDPYDPSADLNLRARSYLHANCSICHVEAGGGNALMELEFTADTKKMRVFDIPPQHDPLGIADARLIAPGNPDRSVLLRRLSTRGPGQMPPLASSLIDEKAVALIRRWIIEYRAPAK